MGNFSVCSGEAKDELSRRLNVVKMSRKDCSKKEG